MARHRDSRGAGVVVLIVAREFRGFDHGTLAHDLAADLPQTTNSATTNQALAQFANFSTEQLVKSTQADGASPELPYWVADDFLRALALLLMAWAWVHIAATPGAETVRWRNAQEGFWRWVWPEFDMRMAMMQATLASE